MCKLHGKVSAACPCVACRLALARGVDRPGGAARQGVTCTRTQAERWGVSTSSSLETPLDPGGRGRVPRVVTAGAVGCAQPASAAHRVANSARSRTTRSALHHVRAESAALGPRGVTRAVEKKHSVVNSNQTQSNSTTVHESSRGRLGSCVDSLAWGKALACFP